MSRFTGPLSVLFREPPLTGATLLETLVWEMDELGSGQFVIVPKLFESDGASVPRLLWWFMPPWGDIATRAAILHDYLRSKISWGTPDVYAPSWAACDKQFYLALVALKVHPLRALALYLGVRFYSLYIKDGGAPYGPEVKNDEA